MVLSDFLLSFPSPTPAPNTLVLQIDAIFFCTHDRRPLCIGPRFPLLSPDFFLQETLQSEESYLLPRAPSADALGRLLAWKPVDFSRSTAGLLVGFVDCLCLCLIRGCLFLLDGGKRYRWCLSLYDLACCGWSSRDIRGPGTSDVHVESLCLQMIVGETLAFLVGWEGVPLTTHCHLETGEPTCSWFLSRRRSET